MNGLVTVLLAIMLGSVVCGISHEIFLYHGSLVTALQKTFIPTTSLQFWFPPCPFCWMARAAAVALIAIFIMNHVAPSTTA